MYWLILFTSLFWKNIGWNDHWTKLGYHSQIYFWSHSKIIVRLSRVLNTNIIYCWIDIRICIGIHYWPWINFRWVYMETFLMFSNHHLCNKSSEFDDIFPLSNANLKTQFEGHLTIGRLLLRNIRKTQHSWNSQVIQKENLRIFWKF